MDTLHELTELFRTFPGIGPRQARRFTHFLLERPEAARALADLVRALPDTAVRCALCRRFFVREGAHTACRMCRSETRDNRTLIVVAHDVDIDALEKSGSYRGRYFVLGKETKALCVRAAAAAKEGLREIILALSASPEGEEMAEAAADALALLAQKHSIKITRLGRGLSTGTELEYADAETLKNALKNRQ